MKQTLGVILNNQDVDLDALTQVRGVTTLPFGGRYRLVDFALSNMVNGGVKKIGVFGSNKYRSLIDHIGTGQEWSLSRKSQDLMVLQGGALNHITAPTSRINLLDFYDNYGFFHRPGYTDMAIFASNIVCNIDLKPILAAHRDSDADVTMVCVRSMGTASDGSRSLGVLADAKGRVMQFSEYNAKGFDRVYVDMMFIRTSIVHRFVEQSRVTHAYDLLEALGRYLNDITVKVYDYAGYIRRIDSTSAYYQSSMDLLNPAIADRLFGGDRTIYTKVKDNNPTMYGSTSRVLSSLVASGCEIDGTVDSSIIFRDTDIAQGAIVKNSVIMESCKIGANVILENVILDRNITISNDVVLQGTPDRPVVLGKETSI